MQSIQVKVKADWCYGCVDRVGVQRFRQLTVNNVCVDCDKQLKPENRKPEPAIEWGNQPQTKKITKEKFEPQKEQKLEKDERLSKEEQELITVFYQLQLEMVGNLWREPAAQQLGWDVDKVKNVIKRVRAYQELRPIPVENHLIKFVTTEYQTAKQIAEKLNRFGVLWVYMNLEKLATQQRIEKITNQPYETLYRLPPTN